ncbi:MAG: hypothetical protein QG574_5472 [Cyanobacteriota bacterium erpe_2018_sw_21hr_WHONDRS-SW48-000092_B_bin.40]|jgi:hypothetical protein|nr:hypothetical protein [Cyanobacteriota bacterium erpe_2018_sw_21hr_WHONDRS-SW48-000092_B_bin.40]
MTPVSSNPKIYHIVHIDKLEPICNAGFLFSDRIAQQLNLSGTNIGMASIKARRLEKLLNSRPGLRVGDCVPFYFCPRSIMLFTIHARNQHLYYKGGQANIIHLEADLGAAVEWANIAGKQWAFTLSNAGSHYFEDRADLGKLNELNWDAINSRQWGGPEANSDYKAGKQAEFLIEEQFPWTLFERIGIMSEGSLLTQVNNIVSRQHHKPAIEIQPSWYY